jgi:hypothetical protein
MDEKLYAAIKNDAHANVLQIDGRTYTTNKVSLVNPPLEPEPKKLEVSTLTSLVDYVTKNPDSLKQEDLIVHIESPTKVSLLSKLFGDNKQRCVHLVADIGNAGWSIWFVFGRYFDAELFNVWLQSCCVDPITGEDEKAKATSKGLMLSFVGNIRESAIKETGDDGISQSVTVKTGIARVGDVVLPNPIVLCPYRTFNEVEQPSSHFVFRARTGPEFALFEADNGAWKHKAIKSIKEFLEREVPNLHIIA